MTSKEVYVDRLHEVDPKYGPSHLIEQWANANVQSILMSCSWGFWKGRLIARALLSTSLQANGDGIVKYGVCETAEREQSGKLTQTCGPVKDIRVSSPNRLFKMKSSALLSFVMIQETIPNFELGH